jgi:hypothetical protein
MISAENARLFCRAAKTLALLFLAGRGRLPLAVRAWLLFTAIGMWLFAMHSAHVLARVYRAAAG